MTKTFLAFSVSRDVLRGAGALRGVVAERAVEDLPAVASAASGSVADGVMIGRPASSKIGLATLDSPEKAGPTMPTTDLVVDGLLGQCRRLVGAPCESNFCQT